MFAAPAIFINLLLLFSSYFFHLLQPALLEGHQRVPQSLGDRQVAEPFLVGRHNEPWRLFSIATVERVLVGRGEVVPKLTVVKIAEVKLPPFFWIWWIAALSWAIIAMMILIEDNR